MPTIRLQHLNESLLGYWIRLCDVVREMITFTPKPDAPLKVDGQKLSYEQEAESKFIHF